MYGPGFGWGFHALALFGVVVVWLVVVAGLLWALYFVIRTAVTRGILRADALRGAPAHRIHAHDAPGHPAPPPRSDAPGAATPADDRRDDPRPPDVAA